MNYDVLIIGGGPAGSATALSLRKHAPQLSTILVEASSYDKNRIGEVLPSLARGMLDHLGVWEAFQNENHAAAHSTLSVWGDAEPNDNNFIFSPHGSGWHLDRKEFDAFLCGQTALAGADVLLGTSVRSFKRTSKKTGGGWLVTLSDGSEKRARFIVDATGRRAFFARKMGAEARPYDRLMSFSRYFKLEKDSAPGTLVEASRHGWWYTAKAGDLRMVSYLTDADIGQKRGLNEQDRWLEDFSATAHISKSAGSAAPTGDALVRPANSMLSSNVCAGDWLSVGDSASAFDPLSSQGIVKSLRSGIFASYAIADHLINSDAAAMPRYEQFIKTEFAAYLKLYKVHYSNERRWRESVFWQRRQN